MFGNPSKEQAALESTYEDTATVTRRQSVPDSSNIARPREVTVYENIICALSKGGDSSRQTQAQQNIAYERKLFIPPDKAVLPGDKIAVLRFGRFAPGGPAEEFQVVGSPMAYATHIEVPLKAVALA